jgi:hypothetical protein
VFYTAEAAAVVETVDRQGRPYIEVAAVRLADPKNDNGAPVSGAASASCNRR